MAVGLIGIMALLPVTSSDADAMSNRSSQAETRVAVTATPTVAVSLDSEVGVDIVPNSRGTFGFASTRLGVSTNNEEGYQIFLTTGDGTGTLKNSDLSKTGAEHEIVSITGDMKGTDFMGNTWGYSLSQGEISEDSTYSAVPTTTKVVRNVNSASVDGEDVYNLGFGTHVSTSLAAGEYSNSVVVSVVANPITISNLSQVVYMQDMKPEFCANTPSAYNEETKTSDKDSPYYLHPVTKRLYDTRDGRQYWVAKLADGNCWMTQDLAFDLTEGDVLTPYDTDVVASWTVPRSTETEIPEKSAADYTVVRSWDLGEIVLTKPTNTSVCVQELPANLAALGYNQDGWNSVFYGYKLAEECGQYYKDVAGMVSGYDATMSNTISEDGLRYDAHYLIGNYYTWQAVTAGTGRKADEDANIAALTDPSKLTDATSSICPKGWQLPTSGRSATATAGWPFDREKSFYKLFRAYGYPETGSSSTNIDDLSTKWVLDESGSNVFTAIAGPEKTRLDYAPMYFVRSGNMNYAFGALRSAAYNGNYWSSTAYPDKSFNVSFYLYFDTGQVYPSSSAGKHGGISVRCVAR